MIRPDYWLFVPLVPFMPSPPGGGGGGADAMPALHRLVEGFGVDAVGIERLVDSGLDGFRVLAVFVGIFLNRGDRSVNRVGDLLKHGRIHARRGECVAYLTLEPVFTTTRPDHPEAALEGREPISGFICSFRAAVSTPYS